MDITSKDVVAILRARNVLQYVIVIFGSILNVGHYSYMSSPTFDKEPDFL